VFKRLEENIPTEAKTGRHYQDYNFNTLRLIGLGLRNQNKQSEGKLRLSHLLDNVQEC